ncbi:MAG: hypothetical protein HGA54_02130 [Actinobacteria bacterium]|nr:hypothetical protein [Actinomycetota bacterium]
MPSATCASLSSCPIVEIRTDRHSFPLVSLLVAITLMLFSFALSNPDEANAQVAIVVNQSEIDAATAANANYDSEAYDIAVIKYALDYYVNNYRAHYGLAPLTRNRLLDTVAQSNSDRMATTGDFSHNANLNSDVPSGWSACSEACADVLGGWGYPGGWRVAEIALYGCDMFGTVPSHWTDYATYESMFQDGFLGSWSHRTILMDTNVNTIGYGVTKAADGSWYITLDLCGYSNIPDDSWVTPTIEDELRTPSTVPSPISRIIEQANQLAGSNRYETSVSIVEEQCPDGSEGVIICTGENFPDALAASSLSGATGYPILLTASNELPSSIADEIINLGASKAYIIGGTGAVSTRVADQVQSALEASSSETSIKRISGTDRIATATAVRMEIEALGMQGDTAIVVTSTGFADALSISPYCAWSNSPLFLAQPDGSLSSESLSAMSDYERVIIVGGTGVIPSSTQNALEGIVGSGNVFRLGGSNRFETSANVSIWSVEQGMTFDGVCVTTGFDYPDAVCGGAFAGSMDTVLLLTSASDSANTCATVLGANNSQVSSLYFLGGTGATPNAVRARICQSLGWV